MIGHLPVSVSVAERGRLVYAHEGFVLRSPASDEKLLLSMALLDRFEGTLAGRLIGLPVRAKTGTL